MGGYAPLFKGEYGGFMAFDVTAHVQRKVMDNFFVNAGLSAGGGGGGKSVQQSKVLSGTGGFYKGYIGLGHDFGEFSLGANVSKMKFTNSAINHTQLDLYVQVPFSYAIAPYANSGEGLGLPDLQYAHFMNRNSYWFFNVGVGVKGLPLYNQVLAGLGYRADLSPRMKVYAQLGLGSGGYAPDTIDTGAGLVVYPKLSAEYLLDKNLGVSARCRPMGSSTRTSTCRFRLPSPTTPTWATRATANCWPASGYRTSTTRTAGFRCSARGWQAPTCMARS